MESPVENASWELSTISLTSEFPLFNNDVSIDWDPFSDLSRFNEGRFDLIIGNYVISWMEVIVVTILCGVMSASGLVANVINVLVFWRQKVLSSSSNVSLLALALSDMGCLLPLLCNSINYAIFLLNKDVMPFLTPQDFTEVYVLWPHIMFMQISSWITVYIAFERCLSVVLPLKVKMIFSPRKSLIAVAAIAFVITMSFVPIYANTRTEEIQDFETNATKLIFSLNEELFAVVDASNILQSIVLRIFAVAIVFICTQITVYRVKLSTTWRKTIATANTTWTSSSRCSSRQDPTKSTINTTVSEIDDANYKTSQLTKSNTMEISSTITENTSATTTPISAITSTTTSTTNFSPDTNCTTSSSIPIAATNTNSNTAATTAETTHRSTTPTTPTTTTTTTTTTTKNKNKSVPAPVAREQRLIRIITMISTIFMVCNAPEIVGIITLIFMENFYGISPWDNLIHLITYFQFFFESINSSINILVYYNMSTRYRLEFRHMFGLDAN